MAVKCDQVLCDQGISGLDVFIQAQSHKSTDLIKAVIGESVAVGHKDQEEIQQQLVRLEAGPEAVAQKAMFDKGEAAVDSPDSFGVKRLFFDPALS